jgi:hypothetical protein
MNSRTLRHCNYGKKARTMADNPDLSQDLTAVLIERAGKIKQEKAK